MSYFTPDKLADVELIAVILGKATVDDECHRMATSIHQEWSSDSPVVDMACESMSRSEMKRHGKLEAAIELGRRSMMTRHNKRTLILSTPEEVAEFITPMTTGQEREHFYCISLNTKNHVKRVVEVSIGSLNASIVHPRELFREAIRVSAASVIVAHNHPSGDTTPSGADIQLTRRLVKAGDCIGIKVLDHVIVGSEGFTSLRDVGLM